MEAPQLELLQASHRYQAQEGLTHSRAHACNERCVLHRRSRAHACKRPPSAGGCEVLQDVDDVSAAMMEKALFSGSTVQAAPPRQPLRQALLDDPEDDAPDHTWWKGESVQYIHLPSHLRKPPCRIFALACEGGCRLYSSYDSIRIF